VKIAFLFFLLITHKVVRRLLGPHDTLPCVLMVRPVIEYSNSVWGPHYIIDQQNIKKMQQRATKSLTGLLGISYLDHLHILNLPSLDLEEI